MEPMLQIVGGVDTHADVHVGAVLTTRGQVLETGSFPTTSAGYQNMLVWFGSFGTLISVGVEGTGSYGKGLTRFLEDRDVTVIEVRRVNRQQRRRYGKTDIYDAVAAARAVLSGEADGLPRDPNGPVEALRVLRIARISAMKSRTATTNRAKAMIITAPEPIRVQLRDLSMIKIVSVASRYRPHLANMADPTHATKQALKSLASQYCALTKEIDELTKVITTVVNEIAPAGLTDQTGIGYITAADMLITYGTNPDRITSAASFVALCGVSPVDASSGKQQRHRLNRGGDRQANSALYRIVLTRLRDHPETLDYLKRRTQEGKTKKEIIRCLKYYVARDIYRTLQNAP